MGMGSALRRRRHWKERFDPAAPFLFTRSTRFDGKKHLIGDPVPPESSVRSLKKMWRAGRIVRADFEPPNVVTGKPQEEPSQHDRIVAAIRDLNPAKTSLYTAQGKPRTNVLEEILGFEVTATARDEAWREVLDG